MATAKKPQYFLLSGKRAKDFESLVLLYEKLKGRKVTPAERRSMRRKFDASN